MFIAAGLLSHAIHEFIEIGALGSGLWTQTAFDISGVLSHEDGVGAILRAIFGYSATPEILTLAGLRRLRCRDAGALPPAAAARVPPTRTAPQVTGS